jgi:hypothetical protein
LSRYGEWRRLIHTEVAADYELFQFFAVQVEIVIRGIRVAGAVWLGIRPERDKGRFDV